MGLFGSMKRGLAFNLPYRMMFGAKDKYPSFDKMARPEEAQYLGMTGKGGELEQRFSMRQQPRGEFEQRLRERALAEGPTAETMRQAGLAGQAAQSSYQQNLSNMAQAGGVSGGARERLAKAASLQGMLGKQRAFQAGEERKLGLQRDISNLEAKERFSDVGALRGDRQRQNQFELDKYKARLAEYAGNEMARQQVGLERNRPKSLLSDLLGGII